MPTCKEFQDLILTDYIDGEMSSEQKEHMDKHLLECVSCRALAEDIKKNIILPLNKAPREAVPTEMWANIKERIEQEHVPQNMFKNFWERFAESFSLVFKFAPILAVFVFAVFLTSVYVQNQQAKQVKEKDQIEYMASLFEPVNSSAGSNTLGTSIEEYFL